ncbi:MAG: 50S ribosomal protein L11 [Rhodospirillaceae bacterium]|jgi:large subunit ribosomal protein L11|nr:50S ribosomal protein L11 [Alphaproteobacteria bacterium]MBT3552381.1 50S ribosomal protein L11 [Rhodospirillaceae bacterium]MBT3883370.1 50S ribosomal protein L11 [Rhodospirillaceae bacterium]MBT4673794.1 50S ribosomal protein L11 [Rhodospirillaceae bacterium]MBT4719166.1 50S ribosomal protein L11 [Rhodospirillaceae bacterium]
MAKKIEGYIRLQIPAGQANPAPPVGPALGQAGLSIPDFCKSFNATTQNLEPGMPIPVRITVYQDKTYSFETKSPPASYYIKKAARVEKGSQTPGIEVIASISLNQVREIAEIKMVDLNANDIDAACKIIAGSARSMGINVEGM